MSQLTSERIFLFALEITDKTFPAVVHFMGKEAERFLNTTVEEFDASEEVRSSILCCLKNKIESRTFMEFRYHVIERKERVMYPMGASPMEIHCQRDQTAIESRMDNYAPDHVQVASVPFSSAVNDRLLKGGEQTLYLPHQQPNSSRSSSACLKRAFEGEGGSFYIRSNRRVCCITNTLREGMLLTVCTILCLFSFLGRSCR